MWLLVLSYYIYITLLGYSSLNLLTRTHYFLAPPTILAVFFLFTLCLNWNLSISLMGHLMMKLDIYEKPSTFLPILWLILD